MNTRPQQQILTMIAITLTFGSGVMDVTAITRLGNVFASVMTGNLVLAGLAAARGSAVMASHTLVSVASFVAGVAAATWIGHAVPAGESRRERRDSAVPAHARRTLLVQLVVAAGFAALWEASEPRPAGATQFGVLVLAAAAMGMQSCTVNSVGLSHVSTTYLTGTLTTLVSSLAKPGQDTPHAERRFGVLLALVAGAALGGLLLRTAAAALPVLSLGALVTALALTRVPVRRAAPDDRAPKSP